MTELRQVGKEAQIPFGVTRMLHHYLRFGKSENKQADPHEKRREEVLRLIMFIAQPHEQIATFNEIWRGQQERKGASRNECK